MDKKLFIPILLGTNREGRKSEHVARWMHARLEEHAEIETKWFDVREMVLPENDYGQSVKEQFSAYKEAVMRADGLVIVAPEYNHGYPGELKSVLDLLLPEYKHKAAGLVGVSAGTLGGARVIENLLPVLRELGLVSIKTDMRFSKVGELFTEDGTLTDSSYEKLVKSFLSELIWMARTLQYGRDQLGE